MGQTVRCASRLAALLMALACGGAPEPGASDASAKRAADPVVEVATAPVRRGAIAQRVFAPGTLHARRESHIGVEVSGRIREIFVRSSDRVESGAPLFQVDPEPYRFALREAEAGLDLARAERMQIEADLERLRSLLAQSIVPADVVDRTRTALAVAKARERQAAEGVALAKHNLAETLVRAPFAGSIAARLVDEGTTALVQPQTIVVVLQETTELEARADLPESEVATVRAGDAAWIEVEGVAERIRTTVSSVADTIDPTTRTYAVRMRVPNPDHALRAGAFARVAIEPEPRTDVLLVPRDAIRSEQARSRVLIVRDGRAEAVPVELGLVSESEVEIVSGVEAGSRVIVGAAARELAPGMRVRVVESANEAARAPAPEPAT